MVIWEATTTVTPRMPKPERGLITLRPLPVIPAAAEEPITAPRVIVRCGTSVLPAVQIQLLPVPSITPVATAPTACREAVAEAVLVEAAAVAVRRYVLSPEVAVTNTILEMGHAGKAMAHFGFDSNAFE